MYTATYFGYYMDSNDSITRCTRMTVFSLPIFPLSTACILCNNVIINIDLKHRYMFMYKQQGEGGWSLGNPNGEAAGWSLFQNNVYRGRGGLGVAQGVLLHYNNPTVHDVHVESCTVVFIWPQGNKTETVSLSFFFFFTLYTVHFFL